MNNKFSSSEGSKIFDMTALKLFISIVAISLATMTSKASTMPLDVFDSVSRITTTVKDDLRSCPVPYKAEYCALRNDSDSCALRELSILQSLKLGPLYQPKSNPFCSSKEGVDSRWQNG